MQMTVYGLNEIAVMGAKALDSLAEINQHYIPNKIVMAANKMDKNFPLLKDKTVSSDQTLIYLCKDYACLQPVSTVEALINAMVISK